MRRTEEMSMPISSAQSSHGILVSKHCIAHDKCMQLLSIGSINKKLDPYI